MTDTRHPDIEIYVKDRSVERIKEWLISQSRDFSLLSSKGQIHEFSMNFPDGPAEVMIHEKVAGKAWVSVWFKTNNTPWSKDLDCAHAAAQGMETQVRCIASGWAEGDDPDEYWKVEGNEQEKIQWHC